MASTKEIEIKNSCRNILLSTLPGHRTEAQVEAIIAYTSMAKIFPASLDEKEILKDLCQNLELVSVAQNTILFLQGQPATSYFVIFSGAVEILQSQDPAHQQYLIRKYGTELMKSFGSKFTKTTLGSHLCSLTENRGFGELALLKEGGTRATAALIQIPSEMIEIGPELYARTLKPFHADQANIGSKYKFLERFKLCDNLCGKTLTSIAYNLEQHSYPMHSVIYKQGDKIDHIFLLDKGEVKQVHTKQGVNIELSVRGMGTVIGATELLGNHSRIEFTYEAMTVVEGYCMTIEDFKHIKQNTNAVLNFMKEEEAWRNLHQSRGTDKLAKMAIAAGRGASKDLPSLLARDLGNLDDKEKEETLGKKTHARAERGRSRSRLNFVLNAKQLQHADSMVAHRLDRSESAVVIWEDTSTGPSALPLVTEVSQLSLKSPQISPSKVGAQPGPQKAGDMIPKTFFQDEKKLSVVHIKLPPKLIENNESKEEETRRFHCIKDESKTMDRSRSLFGFKAHGSSSSLGEFWKSTHQACPQSKYHKNTGLKSSHSTPSIETIKMPSSPRRKTVMYRENQENSNVISSPKYARAASHHNLKHSISCPDAFPAVSNSSIENMLRYNEGGVLSKTSQAPKSRRISSNHNIITSEPPSKGILSTSLETAPISNLPHIFHRKV